MARMGGGRLRRPTTAELVALTSTRRRAPAPFDLGAAGVVAVSAYMVAGGPGTLLIVGEEGTSIEHLPASEEAAGDALRLYDAGDGVLMPRWETWNPLSALTTAGDQFAHNGSTVTRLPRGTVAMGSGTEIDFAAGDRFTKTLTGATTFTATNTSWGHRSVLLEIEPDGQAEPTWPGTTTALEGGTWSTVHTNFVVLVRRGAGTYLRTVSQVA